MAVAAARVGLDEADLRELKPQGARRLLARRLLARIPPPLPRDQDPTSPKQWGRVLEDDRQRADRPGARHVVGLAARASAPFLRARVDRMSVRDLGGSHQALDFGRPVELEPMNAAERRIVHTYLRDRTDVQTHSEGDEPDRRLVVTPVRGA